jgi:hypothetical protein
MNDCFVCSSILDCEWPWHNILILSSIFFYRFFDTVNWYYASYHNCAIDIDEIVGDPVSVDPIASTLIYVLG